MSARRPPSGSRPPRPAPSGGGRTPTGPHQIPGASSWADCAEASHPRFAPPDALQVLVDTRRPLPPHCPHCGGAPLTRWGTFSGRQRYRCKACGRTSSDLTGTALAYSKKVDLWGPFAATLLRSLSVRETARRLGIHKDTAWRWRHRLLERLPTAPPLSGTVELLEVRVLVNRKGERRLPRPAVRRGRAFPLLPRLGSGPPPPTPRGAAPSDGQPTRAPAHGRSGERTAQTGWRGTPATGGGPETAVLLVACDREEHGRARLVWHTGPRRTDELAALLGLRSAAPGEPRREPAASDGSALRLLSRGSPLSAYGELAWLHGLYHRRVPFTAPGVHHGPGRGRRPRNAEHLGTISSAVRRLRAWLRRFRGVATKYLLRYWAWHRFLDALGWPEALRRLLRVARGDGADRGGPVPP